MNSLSCLHVSWLLEHAIRVCRIELAAGGVA